MQYDAKTPSEYIEILDDDWRREKLEELRVLIKLKAPSLFEGINYKMLSYGDENSNVFHLNAQKHYVSLYVGNVGIIDPDGELLKGINIGKSCIRFNKSLSLSDTRIEEFIERAVQLWRQGADIEC
ncbi:MAG: DUF1801 domain-containing protein [Cocleimonas sp.]